MRVAGALRLAAAVVACGLAGVSAQEPNTRGTRLLFIGNSYTYFNNLPAIVQRLGEAAGVGPVDVRMVAPGGMRLEDHWRAADAHTALREGPWDVVVLQEQSDAALPQGRGANANFPQFSAYADKVEKFIHIGAAESYRERDMYNAIYGSTANCVAAGGTTASCTNSVLRNIPANPNANAAAKVYLTQTWARPDMVFPHLNTVPDANYPTVPDGRPIVDTSNPAFPNGYPDTLYYEAEGLAGMTADLRAAFAAKLQSNPNFAGVIPVGDAFQRAVDTGIAKADGFYTAEGVYATMVPQDRINLWWDDYLHASRHGSYLSALVIFGQLTGINPASFGASEKAAADLGISPGDAVKLQHVAWEQLAETGMPLVTIPCLHAHPDAPGAGPDSRSRLVCERGR